MFERYSERARRAIFFARYEAGRFSSSYIETEHLLLGVLREDSDLREKLGSDAVAEVRRRFDATLRRGPEPLPASVDIPLSHACKRVLAHAAEESSGVNHEVIDLGHLVLGLLREGGNAAIELENYGVSYEPYRSFVAEQKPPPAASGRVVYKHLRHRAYDYAEAPAGEESPARPRAEAMIPSVERLAELIGLTRRYISPMSEADGLRTLHRSGLRRIEALGHLVDCATTHHRWIARTLTEPKVVDSSYPPLDWATAQDYRNYDFVDMVDLWLLMNRLLLHVLARVPEDKLGTPCRIGLDAPIPLSKLIDGYLEHCADFIGQILTRG